MFKASNNRTREISLGLSIASFKKTNRVLSNRDVHRDSIDTFFFYIVTIWLWNIFISWTNRTFMLDMYDLKCFKFELHLKIYIFMCLFRHIISVRFSVGTSVFHGNRHLKTAFYLPFSTIFPLEIPSAWRFSVNQEARNGNENDIFFLEIKYMKLHMFSFLI